MTAKKKKPVKQADVITDIPLDPVDDTNPAALSGVDALGFRMDTGISTVPTQRPSTVTDVHTLVPSLSARELDTGTSAANRPALPPAHHAPTTLRR